MEEKKMTQKIQEIQSKTIKDVMQKLKKHHKCLLVRPTGFGKTKTAVDIMKKYKHIIFLYPFKNIENAVRRYDVDDLDLHLFTYAKIRNMYKKRYSIFKDTFSKFNTRNTIIIMDEAHFIGAHATSKVIKKLMDEICPKANYLGLTATPNRTDKLEIKWHFFDGISAFKYDLFDAIRDGIYPKPYYVYTPLNGNELENQLNNKIDSLSVSEAKKEQLKTRIKKIINPERLNINNLDEIIENNLYKFKNDMDYYKFILFFTTYNNIHTKRDEIVSAFQKVFPHCTINVIIVSSESHIFRNNLELVDQLRPRENTIDLILNINMLAFGYHTDDITGIMMFRQTISNIIYSQQIGRCLSVVQKQSAIIFDFVENLHKSIPNSIVKFNDNPSVKNINKIDLVFPEEFILLDERTKELLSIDRLTNNATTEEFEAEVVNAYKLGLVNLDYCVMKLQLHAVNDFYKILERYGIK